MVQPVSAADYRYFSQSEKQENFFFWIRITNPKSVLTCRVTL
jgi:hypothetical protein